MSADVCYIHQSSVNGGLARWVAPPDPCRCTETRPGGVNTKEQEPPNGYLEEVLLTRDQDKLREWFGCEISQGIDCMIQLRPGSCFC